MKGKSGRFNQISYQNEYIKEKYDRINLTVPKGRNRGKERPVYILSDKPINKGILVIRNIIKIIFICSLNY